MGFNQVELQSVTTSKSGLTIAVLRTLDKKKTGKVRILDKEDLFLIKRLEHLKDSRNKVKDSDIEFHIKPLKRDGIDIKVIIIENCAFFTFSFGPNKCRTLKTFPFYGMHVAKVAKIPIFVEESILTS